VNLGALARFRQPQKGDSAGKSIGPHPCVDAGR
jgi:hypothetical protein